QRANTGPGEVDLIEGGARESAPRFLLEIADVLLGRGDLAGITVIVGVRGAHDRRVSPGDNEEEPPVTLREENVRLLHRTAGDEVHALCQSEERVRFLAERRDGAVEPRSGRDDREASSDLEGAIGCDVAYTRSDDVVAFAKEVDNPGVVEHDRAVIGRVDEVLDDEPLDEWDLCVVEAPRSGEPVRLKRRLRRERASAVEVLPPRKALVQW